MSTCNDLPDGWIVHQFNEDLEEIQCIKLQRQKLYTPVIILHLLLIHSDLTWEVRTANHLVSSNTCVLSQFTSQITNESIISLIRAIDSSNFCTGNFDEHFIALAKQKKGKFLTFNATAVATLEEGICFLVDGAELYSTIRHVNCEILLSSSTVCSICTSYRNTLRALVCKQKVQALKLHPNVNTRFLRTPQRSAHIRSLRTAIRNKNRQLKRLRCKLEKIVEDDSVAIDNDLSQDLQAVIANHSNDAETVQDDFKRIFWQQQVVKYVYSYSRQCMVLM